MISFAYRYQYQDEEYSGYLNFKGKEDFHEFLEETKNCEDLSSDGLFFNSNIFEKDGKYYEETNGKRVEIIGYDPVPIDCVPESWIENYPEHKKIMQKWISISAHRHIEIEKIVKAIDIQTFGSLDEYVP